MICLPTLWADFRHYSVFIWLIYGHKVSVKLVCFNSEFRGFLDYLLLPNINDKAHAFTRALKKPCLGKRISKVSSFRNSKFLALMLYFMYVLHRLYDAGELYEVWFIILCILFWILSFSIYALNFSFCIFSNVLRLLQRMYWVLWVSRAVRNSGRISRSSLIIAMLSNFLPDIRSLPSFMSS